MGTRAYWFHMWRTIRLDEDGDRLAPVHATHLRDLREDADLNLVLGETALVEKYNKRSEAFEPYGTVSKERLYPNHPRNFTHRIVVRRWP